jgi:hypothetical protein
MSALGKCRDDLAGVPGRAYGPVPGGKVVRDDGDRQAREMTTQVAADSDDNAGRQQPGRHDAKPVDDRNAE